MVLEDLLRRPCVLTRYRLPPLGPELDGFCNWLGEQGYSYSYLRLCASRGSQFNLFLRRRGITTASEIEEEHADQFLARRRRTEHASWLVATRRALRLLSHFLAERGVLNPRPEIPSAYEVLLNRYARYLENDRGLAASTVRCYRFYLTSFVEALDLRDVRGAIADLTPQDVQDFFCKCAQGKATTTRGHIRLGLRHFFAFCVREGYGGGHLADAVPHVYSYRLADVPRQIPEPDARMLLDGIDRHTSVGRRDYAIVLLLYTYGVRGGQVRTLRLSDIQWRQSTIRFPACKGGRQVIEPLTDEVGEALLDYLRNGRPRATCPEVFLTERAPIHPMQADHLYTRICSRLRSLGLGDGPRGPHGFRHAFATRLLDNGHSIKTIADMLGHRDINSTFIYTKVDFRTLEQVPLDWPGGTP